MSQLFKIKLIIFALGLLLSLSSSASSLHSLKYELYFKTSYARFMPGHDYRLLKAQCWQESRFNPYAVSPVGAKGLCQFMPQTWSEAKRYLKFNESAFSEKHNIYAAAWYDSRMYAFWSSPRPIADRYNLMLASYNAGAGNVHESQKRCDNPLLYNAIIECLPLITGLHSKETIDYVKRINRYYGQLKW